MSQGRLPLFGVVFVDWHGVLSEEPFWTSVLRGNDRRLRSALASRLDEVFAGDEAEAWMLGNTCVDRIVRPIEHVAARTRRPRFLQRQILRDCRRMAVDPDLLDVVRGLLPEAYLVVATDNTNEFEQAFRAAERPRRQAPHDTLERAASVFDDIICSSTVGALKARDPWQFFGPWLETNGLGFANALLVDDRDDNCAAFEACGGRAVRWPADPMAREQAIAAIRDFVAGLPPVVEFDSPPCPKTAAAGVLGRWVPA